MAGILLGEDIARDAWNRDVFDKPKKYAKINHFKHGLVLTRHFIGFGVL